MNRLPIIDIQAIVAETLRTEPTRDDIRQTVCSHKTWDHLKQWCTDCGFSKRQSIAQEHWKN